MTTAQKYEYKTNGYNTPWDPTTSITAYFTLLNCFQVSLGDRGIATIEDKKQWQQAHKCGGRRFSPKTKWLHGKASQRQV